ncbi:hypothetical protein WICMUC_003386 [Wickerhamomyces mucosus]|uniref:AB hydrolase-1 domain-containing protein n=1 Tax=Wickerhamomyces mucosus TaxID=1378264 RepID=A0A9P8TD35_9ASCO|nr:hypothetical protein WICMUC_003386 [Wickerhamomyces mucosus]
MSNIRLNNLLKGLTNYITPKSPLISKPKENAVSKTHKLGYRRSTAPTALPLSKILTTKLFPLSINESLKDYKTRKRLDFAQENLLSLLPFHNAQNSSKISKIIKTDVGGGNFINEFMIHPKDADFSKLNHLVLIHGYGAGLGFYLKNFDEISENKNWCIHSLDLLGYGCSSRPKYLNDKSIESWFIDSLETWRCKRGIDRMLMCSHSLGAYMSILYTIKYPKYVNKLLLISPAGIYKSPNPPGKIPIWFDYLWEQNISPFSLVRNAGPLGSLVTSGWTSRRFAKLTKSEQFYLHKYTYAIFNAPGSGEYFMSTILAAGGVPKNPLVNEIDKISCDSVWCYGDEDWMPKEGGLQSMKIINKKGDFNSEFKIFKNSGHHIYLDNYKDFNQFLNDEMLKYEKTYL